MRYPANDEPQNVALLKDAANALRALAMDAVEKANSGHPGMPMGMADVVTVLFARFLKVDPQNPAWHNRDRFVLSAGHGSMLLYALSYLLGYEEMTLDQIKNFRQWNSITPGHPEYHPSIGVETTTGPLGQGLANAVGMALAEKILRARFGSPLVDHYTYVVVGDGCLMEGISQESISFAGHHKLNKLIVLFDDNQISIDGPTSLSTSDDMMARFKASQWHVLEVDGHDMRAIEKALESAHHSDAPTLVACKTIIGYGAPTKSGTAQAHGSPLGRDEIEHAKKFLNWPFPAFEIPDELLNLWRSFASRGSESFRDWENNFLEADETLRHQFTLQHQSLNPEHVAAVTSECVRHFQHDRLSVASRQSSGMVLDALVAVFPQLMGGSADLTGSNNTKAQTSIPITPDQAKGNYIFYGIREHAMAGIMNGLSLHGGFRPYGGTFLVFSDYCRPAIRLSALMHQPVIYIMTHDSIGLGEDGPTHQPIEHLASLRAIPNLYVFRPADAVEVAECWEIALTHLSAPSLLSLTRQKLPMLRQEPANENMSKRGAYSLRPHSNPDIILIATGSEVSLALAVADKLNTLDFSTRVVSMPCTTLFDQQSVAYKEEVLGKATDTKLLRVSIEAASPYGWDRYVGAHGLVIGIDHFGASAPFEEIYKHFGLAVDPICEKILNKLKG